MKELKPALASQYERFVLSIYNRPVGVKPKQYEKFRKREIELQQLGARMDIYARLVCLLWQGWVADSKFTILPQNVFLGKKSLDVFMVYWAMKSVNYDYSASDKEHTKSLELEYLFASNYLAYKSNGGIMDEQDYLRAYMKGKAIRKWWNGSRFPLIQHTIDRLTSHGYYKTTRECYNYDDIRG